MIPLGHTHSKEVLRLSTIKAAPVEAKPSIEGAVATIIDGMLILWLTNLAKSLNVPVPMVTITSVSFST
jgi:hypothetical protein